MLGSTAQLVFEAPDNRDIATGRQVDLPRVLGTLPLVILPKPPSQAMGFHPDDRVFAGVISWISLEELHSNEGFLSLALHGLPFHQIAQEIPQAWA